MLGLGGDVSDKRWVSDGRDNSWPSAGRTCQEGRSGEDEEREEREGPGERRLRGKLGCWKRKPFLAPRTKGAETDMGRAGGEAP